MLTAGKFVVSTAEMTQSTNHEAPVNPFLNAPQNRWRRALDKMTWASALGGVLLMIAILLIIFFVLLRGSWMALTKIGWHFFTTQAWNPVTDHYGVLAFLYGTGITTLIALLLGVPISIGTAVFITRIAPRWLAGPVSFLVEVLAAIPSIAYGLWGAFVMSPWLQLYGEPVIDNALKHLNFMAVGQYPNHKIEYFPSNLVHGGPSGSDFFAGGLILTIMILPIITAITRDVLQQFPPEIEQGAYGLGATWWQTTRLALTYCRIGIFGAIILGMARAIGETMAIVMVIGNTDQVRASLFAGGQTMSGVLANEFMEADHPIYFSAMVYVALVLMISALLTNIAARVLLSRIEAERKAA
jgi:phosphate transport system permease protein